MAKKTFPRFSLDWAEIPLRTPACPQVLPVVDGFSGKDRDSIQSRKVQLFKGDLK